MFGTDDTTFAVPAHAPTQRPNQINETELWQRRERLLDAFEATAGGGDSTRLTAGTNSAAR
jgi:hypothetical protein